MQSRTAGGCTVPLRVAASFSAWQVRLRACGVEVISLMRAPSLLTRTSWQLRQPVAIAEWTALPLVFSSGYSRHFAESTFLSSGTGCSFANAAMSPIRKRNASSWRRRGRASPKLAFRFIRKQLGGDGTIANRFMCTILAFDDVEQGRVSD